MPGDPDAILYVKNVQTLIIESEVNYGYRCMGKRISIGLQEMKLVPLVDV